MCNQITYFLYSSIHTPDASQNMGEDESSHMLAIKGSRHCAQQCLPFPTPSHRHLSKSSLGNREYKTRRHYLCLVLVILSALTFAIAKDLWYLNTTPGALWGWMTSQTSMLIHDMDSFDWEAASLCDRIEACINMVLLPDYTIDRCTLLFLLWIIQMRSP